MEVTQILLNCQNPDPQIRTAAEQQINAAREASLLNFFTILCGELADESKPSQSRSLAGLLLKNALDAREEHRKEQLVAQWIGIDPETKTRVRHVLLQTLHTADLNVATAAAQVISKVAAIEVPRHEWNDLIAQLMEKMNNAGDNAAIQIATLKTLGFICEEISGGALCDHANAILTAIVKGMDKDNANKNVTLTAITALNNALEFASANFENESERNFIMHVVCENTQNVDQNCRVAAYQCLVKIASLYYEKLAQYMQVLFELTFKAIKEEPDEVAQQAVEFWSTLCDEEIDLQAYEEESSQNQHYVRGASQFLLPLLTETLAKQEEDQDEDSWNVSTAAGTCLVLVANCIQDAVVEPVMKFVLEHIRNANWHYREAATMAFGSILEGPSDEALHSVVEQAIPVILLHMKDPVVLVKDTAAWTLGRICEFRATAVQNGLPQVVQTLLESLQDEPRVAGNSCWAISNLCESLSDYEAEASSPISPFFNTLCEVLLKTTLRDDVEESNLRTASYEALNAVIRCGAMDSYPTIAQICPVILERLQGTFSMQIVSIDDKEQQSELQGLLCGCLQVMLQKLGSDMAQFTDQAMGLFLQVFQSRNAAVHEEALMAIGEVANAVEKDFMRYMPAFAPFLIGALKNWEEAQVCAGAVGVVGDISRALEEGIAPYCDEIVQSLLENLQNPRLNRDVKPPILACIGDIALALNGGFEKYCPATMQVLAQAAQTQVDMEDYDLVDFINALRESVFEAYTGILQGMKASQREQHMLPYAESMLQAVAISFADNNRFENVLRAAVALVGDIGTTLASHPNVRSALQQPFVSGIVRAARDSSNQSTKETAEWTASVLSTVGIQA